MKLTVQLIVHPEDDAESATVVREVFAVDRDALACTAGFRSKTLMGLPVVSTEIPTIWPVCTGHGVAADLRAPHSGDVDRTF
jgi:hypothetical protein